MCASSLLQPRPPLWESCQHENQIWTNPVMATLLLIRAYQKHLRFVIMIWLAFLPFCLIPSIGVATVPIGLPSTCTPHGYPACCHPYSYPICTSYSHMQHSIDTETVSSHYLSPPQLPIFGDRGWRDEKGEDKGAMKNNIILTAVPGKHV